MNSTNFFNQFQNIQEYRYPEAVASDIREQINDMASDDLGKAERYGGRLLQVRTPCHVCASKLCGTLKRIINSEKGILI